MIYFVSGCLVYSLLMFVHHLLTSGKKAKIYAVLHFLSVVISLSLILTRLV